MEINYDFLSPVDEELLQLAVALPASCIGQKVEVHSLFNRPKLPRGQKFIALLGVQEMRASSIPSEKSPDFTDLRKKLYALHSGDWHYALLDLGDLPSGEQLKDTYLAFQEIVKAILSNDGIPLIIGGGQDLVYHLYRAYDDGEEMVNFVNIDAKFNLGDFEAALSAESFVGKMVVDKPYNLLNYTNLAYQTYYNSQEEIRLMESLYFDFYRLGELHTDIKIAEPALRDADIVSLDVEAIKDEGFHPVFNELPRPNGIDGLQLCKLMHYTGISDRVSSLCISHLNTGSAYFNMLMAQGLWYFIEGVNNRYDESPDINHKDYIKYIVPLDEEVIIFVKSLLSGRWWIKIPFLKNYNNINKIDTLLACTEQDYLEACAQKIPARWLNIKRKAST
ncbi:MAG: formimidoylglutamase [Flavobacteriaceae bacterium]|nr:formimidoylglutamase [Flavobacteriaceae bacterium]